MRNTEIVGKFGELFVAALFRNMEYEVDLIDAEGIDLVCYDNKDSNIKYGVSVKTRRAKNENGKINYSINIDYNDIVYTYKKSKDIRGVIPAYAFVVVDLKRIDVLIVTQDYVFKRNLFNSIVFNNIDEYMSKYKSKKDSGSKQCISIAKSSRDGWKTLKDEPGVIFTASYRTE